MANYQETVTEGEITKWNRARQIVADNPHGGAPQITCYETEITSLPDGSIVEKSLSNLTHVMTDPTLEIPLIDPESFEQTAETTTAGQIWLALASVYIWMSKQQEA